MLVLIHIHVQIHFTHHQCLSRENSEYLNHNSNQGKNQNTNSNEDITFTKCRSSDNKQGKSEGFDSCDQSSNLAQI